MPLVALEGVSIAFGHLPLLDNIALRIEPRERIAVIGRNGTGKSTLLKILSGTIEADSGTVWLEPGLRIARLEQDVPLSADRSVAEIVMEGLITGPAKAGHYVPNGDAVRDGDEAGPPEGGHYVLEAGHDEEWRRDHAVDLVLSRLNLDGEAIVDTLSGGWRRRVLLARALVGQPCEQPAGVGGHRRVMPL
jgi:ATP-binding cassette subfamily F protein uup